MASLKKTAVAVTVGVWTSALGSAVALGFVLNRPPEPRTRVEPATAHASVGHLLEAAPHKLLEVPATPKVTPARQAAPKPAPPVPVDIAQMKCDEWRELQAGSGRVRVCE